MINRPVYLNQLTAFKDTELIKVITGIRRCGKSSLLALYSEYLKAQNIKEENIIQINQNKRCLLLEKKEHLICHMKKNIK